MTGPSWFPLKTLLPDWILDDYRNKSTQVFYALHTKIQNLFFSREYISNREWHHVSRLTPSCFISLVRISEIKYFPEKHTEIRSNSCPDDVTNTCGNQTDFVASFSTRMVHYRFFSCLKEAEIIFIMIIFTSANMSFLSSSLGKVIAWGWWRWFMLQLDDHLFLNKWRGMETSMRLRTNDLTEITGQKWFTAWKKKWGRREWFTVTSSRSTKTRI